MFTKVSLTELNKNWEFRLLSVGNLAAATDAVTARIEKGLATPKALEVTMEARVNPKLVGASFAAEVPGDVHTDLQRLGLIENPHLGLNEFKTQWIGRCEWEYKTTFEVHDLATFNQLEFGGLDTIAEVYLNGKPILSAKDMHLKYQVDVNGLLRKGANELTVVFASQEDWAEAQEKKVGKYPNAYSDPTNQIRKMACNYGWDWGPTLVTAGIWRPIQLVQWDKARIDGLVINPTVDEGIPTILISGELLGSADCKVQIKRHGETLETINASGASFEGRVSIAGLDLWWPVGYGDQPLYEFEIELIDSEGSVLETIQKRLGFRRVELVSEPDSHGTSFEIRINGQRIWARGANWIPDHTSLNEVTPERYRKRIQDARDANMNLLRIWGGGIFETEDFYNVCDELGILVWQDFLFACAAYPEDEVNSALVEQEAIQAVTRLSSHCSLVLWNGSNENIWGYFDWDWQKPLAGRSWGQGYYQEIIPAVIAKLDPTRPYQPSSPWSGTMEIHPNDPNHGTAHLWEPWNRQDYPTYLDEVPRFVTEYGYQSPASYSTLKKAIGESELWEDSEGMKAHQKAFIGKEKLHRGLDLRFPGLTRNFDAWHYLTQLEHSRALNLGIRHLRSHHDVSAGSVIWQLNDCWPVVSWSMIDFEGKRKPAWHVVRRAYAPQIVSFSNQEGVTQAVLVNDGLENWSADLRIYKADLSGKSELIEQTQHEVETGSHQLVKINLDLAELDPTTQFLVADAGGDRSLLFLNEDSALAYEPVKFQIGLSKAPEGIAITIKAESLLRELCIFVDRIDDGAEISDAAVTLLDGETITLIVTTSQPELFTEAAIKLATRCANEYKNPKLNK
jgi:beta-mannosidase